MHIQRMQITINVYVKLWIFIEYEVIKFNFAFRMDNRGPFATILDKG